MKTALILVGKTVNKHLQACIDDYVERLGHYMPFELVGIPELKNTKNLSEEQQKEREGELILKQLQAQDYLVLLDEHGKELRSRWSLRFLPCRLSALQRTALALQDDFLAPDGENDFR